MILRKMKKKKRKWIKLKLHKEFMINMVKRNHCYFIGMHDTDYEEDKQPGNMSSTRQRIRNQFYPAKDQDSMSGIS